MYQFILLIHVFIAVIVIALVLVQQGKGATMGAAFGSGASQTVFGSKGSGSFLFRVTIGLAILFFVTSIGLNYLATQAYKQDKSITLPHIPITSTPANSLSNKSSPTNSGSNANGTKEQKSIGTSLPGEIPERK
jgi:preprotein translocase subunit SecG